MIGQADDRIGDELAGAVEGDVTAAIALDDFDPALLELPGRGEQVSIDAGTPTIG